MDQYCRNIGVFFFLTYWINVTAEMETCPRQCECDMRGDLRRATCENLNIVEIDVGVPDNVEIYDLNHNSIIEVKSYVFKDLGLTSLVELNLSYNIIFWIGVNALAGLKKLKRLNLSNNRLRAISPDLFWYNDALEHLDLSGNMFQKFENEPFIAHSGLKILNLSNCHIPYLVTQAFSALASLEVLDLSENYMVEIRVSVLLPLNKLSRLSLRDNQWRCDSKFKEVETWIAMKKIRYDTQCRNNNANNDMFAKMVSLAPKVQREEVDIKKVWNIPTESKLSQNNVTHHTSLTFTEIIDERFPSFWALVVGFQIGLLLGVFGTYFWMASLCKCNKINCWRSEPERPICHRVRFCEDNEMRVNLLRSTLSNVNSETPPSHRRQLSPQNHNSNSLWEELPTIPEGRETSHTSSEELPARSESPPPPYNECGVGNIRIV